MAGFFSSTLWMSLSDEFWFLLGFERFTGSAGFSGQQKTLLAIWRAGLSKVFATGFTCCPPPR